MLDLRDHLECKVDQDLKDQLEVLETPDLLDLKDLKEPKDFLEHLVLLDLLVPQVFKELREQMGHKELLE
jgi:hypothetical protein